MSCVGQMAAPLYCMQTVPGLSLTLVKHFFKLNTSGFAWESKFKQGFGSDGGNFTVQLIPKEWYTLTKKE